MKMKMALFALSALSSAAVSSAFLERTKVGTTEVDEQVKDEKFFVNGIYDPLRWAHDSKILDKLNQADPFYVKDFVLPISWTDNAMEQLDSVKHNQLKKGQVLVGAADKFGRKLPRMYITDNHEVVIQHKHSRTVLVAVDVRQFRLSAAKDWFFFRKIKNVSENCRECRLELTTFGVLEFWDGALLLWKSEEINHLYAKYVLEIGQSALDDIVATITSAFTKKVVWKSAPARPVTTSMFWSTLNSLLDMCLQLFGF